ncbi:MAG: copper-containing nitrite reductase [Verrucomicrobiota bacterium]
MIIRSIPVLAGLAFLISGPSSVYAQNEIVAQTNLANLIDPEVSGVETAVLAQAPNVPSPIKRKFATKVIVNLEVREVTKRLADGVDYVFWTFGGDVPGSFIRIREGDQVEFHLNNHQNNKMPHSIDLHAVSGPGGGAASSFTAPGHSSQFSFKALHSGLFVYHCATAPVGMHIASGMYGLILVEPTGGLPPVDREYYAMQGEFYTTGQYGEEGLQGFDMNKAVDERPPYVVFNGAVDSLVGDQAMTAKAGETVRLFFGNGGPNLTSSFHIIGGQFDTLYEDGTMTNVLHNVQTTAVPPGSAVVVDFRLKAPGTYVLVDHAIFRAFNKGALGMLKVDGPQDLLVYSGKEVDATYIGKAADAGSAAEKKVVALTAEVAREIKSNPKIADLSKQIQFQKGKTVYMQTCFVCHQPTGQGIPEQIPPLALSDFLATQDKDNVIRGVLMGRTGKITVNGKTYNGTMIPLNYLTDDQVANVLTYVRNNWGNSGDAVSVTEVAKIRHESAPPPANQYE